MADTELNWKNKVSSMLDNFTLVYRNLSEYANTLTRNLNALTAVVTSNKNATDVDIADKGMRPGFIGTTASANIPEGYLLCNGAAVSREEFADLYAAIGIKYGAGDGETTFNLPNLVNRFIQGASATNVGATINAGAPDISGSIWNADRDEGPLTGPTAANGAFGVWHTGGNGADGDGGGAYGFNFYASRSSGVYGASSTIQPPAVAMYIVIKY